MHLQKVEKVNQSKAALSQPPWEHMDTELRIRN